MPHPRWIALGALASITAFGACSGDLHERNVTAAADTGVTTIDAGDSGAPSADASEAGACPTTVTVHFDSDIQKDIDTFSCSSTSCHGASAGKFKLTASASGTDLDANYNEFKARALADENSAVLVKAIGGDKHGGGSKFTTTDAVYTRWLTWIRECNPR